MAKYVEKGNFGVGKAEKVTTLEPPRRRNFPTYLLARILSRGIVEKPRGLRKRMGIKGRGHRFYPQDFKLPACAEIMFNFLLRLLLTADDHAKYGHNIESQIEWKNI